MSFLTVLAGSKIAVGALTLGTLAAGGTAAAAYTGSLPSSLQESAHTLIGAPAPTVEVADTTNETDTAESTPAATPVGPDATGPAAYGLCNAYMHGGLSASSTAYASLATAALGADSATKTADDVAIKAYCDTITSPGQSAAHRPASAGADAHATSPGKSYSHRSAADTSEGSDETTQTDESTAPLSSTHVGLGRAHKPTTHGRP